MKRALLIIDYQNDFVTGSLGFPGAVALEEPICRKAEEYRKSGDDIIFTLDTHGVDYLATEEGKNLPVEHCLRGSEGWKLYGRLSEYCTAAAPCFEKPGFPSLELGNYLQKQGYDVVELVGIVSNICVLSNAVITKAALPNAHIVVDAACTAGFDPVLHEKALDVMGGLQIEVINRGQKPA